MNTCKICGNETITYKHPRFDMIFHECENCEFIYKDDQHILQYDDELKAYDRHQNTEENIGYVNFLTNFIDAAIIPYIKKGDVLDFGSGPNPVLAKIMKEQYLFNVDIYDLFYATHKIYENKKYDLITLTEVIEHLSQPMDVFKLLAQHLKSDGFLSLMTLFHPKDREAFFDWFYIRDITHLSFYTPKTIKHITEQLNLKVVYTNNYRYMVLKKTT